MRKPILTDILNVIFIIRQGYKSEDIDGFIFHALSGGILDKKTKKQFEAYF